MGDFGNETWLGNEFLWEAALLVAAGEAVDAVDAPAYLVLHTLNILTPRTLAQVGQGAAIAEQAEAACGFTAYRRIVVLQEGQNRGNDALIVQVDEKANRLFPDDVGIITEHSRGERALENAPLPGLDECRDYPVFGRIMIADQTEQLVAGELLDLLRSPLTNEIGERLGGDRVRGADGRMCGLGYRPHERKPEQHKPRRDRTDCQ